MAPLEQAGPFLSPILLYYAAFAVCYNEIEMDHAPAFIAEI